MRAKEAPVMQLDFHPGKSYISKIEQFEEFDNMVHIAADILMRLFSHATLFKLSLAKQYGFNVFQFLALSLVGNAQAGLTIKDLRKALAIPGSSLTFTLDSLEKRRLIRRSRSKDDRRQWILFLTAKGKRLYSDILTKQSEAIGLSLEGFTEAERAAFLKIAEEICQAGATLA
jgi:DNA-binding MarR family transcriptional regulator